MKCEKCGKEVKNGKFCPDCGGELKKKKFKLSVITIISLIVLILVSIPVVGAMIYAVADGSEAAGWLFLIAGMIGVFIIGYYSMIFVGSIICDCIVRRNNIIQTIIVIVLMLLPGIWLLFQLAETKKDNEKLTYEYSDMSISFPDGMSRGGTSKDFDGKYDMVEFSNAECAIRWGVSKYNSDLSLIGNFKENSDRFTIIKNNPNTIYEDFDSSYSLGNKNINGKTWNLYEKNYNKFTYKLYGIKLNNKFYRIQVEDKNPTNNNCVDLTKEVIDSVKYK